MMRATWVSFLVVVALSGCVSYTPPAPSPPASPESDAQAKQFLPPQGKGNVYVARPGELVLLGKPVPYAVTADGKPLGGLMPGMYYCIALEPGNHALGAVSESSTANAAVAVEAGKNYTPAQTFVVNNGRFQKTNTPNEKSNTPRGGLSHDK